MFWRMIASGATATRLMTDTMNAAPRMGLAKVDIASILGSMFNHGKCAAPRSAQWKAGMGVHYLLGALVFPAAYHAVFKRVLPGGPGAKSMEWGLGLWLTGQFAIMPALRKFGYFKEAPDAGLTYLIGHLVYGALFGAGSGKKPD
jgi:hypothetical protein